MVKRTPITVAYGDGIGPEIMAATLTILEAAGAQIDIEVVEMGEKLYLAGHPTGIEDKTWESLQRTKVFLKAPMITPQGGGYRSLNVTVRGRLGLYANIRPCVSYYPFIETKHHQMDVVIVRENEEDLYTGIEYQHTPNVAEALKIITRQGCERVIQYAFEYAKTYGRKKVTCFTKDNILKMTDGLFHKIFDEMGKEYPEIEKEHWIVDIGAAKLATTPEQFDVIVLPNLYGDILSDVCGLISGSVGLSGSANIGDHAAMFEAVHGSAPKMAGKNVANPSGLLFGAIFMLVHIGQPEIATKIHNALLKTIEEGVHTYDIFHEGVSKKKVGTKEFATEVIARLGKEPLSLKKVEYGSQKEFKTVKRSSSHKKRHLVGVDAYIYCEESIEELKKKVKGCETPSLKLAKISNRGAEIWPNSSPDTFCVDLWRCRFFSSDGLTGQTVAALIHRLSDAGLDCVKAENLYTYESEKGYSD
jgi:isocitrate dehydrogenase